MAVIKAALLLLLTDLSAATAYAAPEPYRNPFDMTFVTIPAGSFTMGTQDLQAVLAENPDSDIDTIRDETPAHAVHITRPFYLGETEVTQGQWLAVMGTKPGPTDYWSADDWQHLPVVSVSWNDAQRFIQRLQQRDPRSRYRLPTEAEWEYAARAGTTDLRPVPLQHLQDHAWYIANSGDVPHPVATRQPNAWGLFDMLGNAWEWTVDYYAADYYARAEEPDPAGPEQGVKRVRRGGSYHCPTPLVRPGYRAADTPDTTYSVIGFRLVAEPVREARAATGSVGERSAEVRTTPSMPATPRNGDR